MTEGSLYALTLSTLSPTVPGGDTPCLTAGDARRANPWIEGKAHSPTPAASHSSPLLHVRVTPPRFQCDAAGVGIRVVCLSTGSPSLCSGITRGYAWCASAGGVTLCGCGGGAVGEGGSTAATAAHVRAFSSTPSVQASNKNPQYPLKDIAERKIEFIPELYRY